MSEPAQQMPAPDSTKGVYLFVMLLIVAMGSVAIFFVPAQLAPILAFCGSILAALLATLKGQTSIHLAVNSKMDKLLLLVEESSKAKGKLEGIAQEKSDQQK